MITDRLGYTYQKNSERMYEEILSKQGDAIRNAERLERNYNPPNPSIDNPSTTVHLLVRELNKYIW